MLWFIVAIAVLTACEGEVGPLGPKGSPGRDGRDGERGATGPPVDTSVMEARIDSLEALINALIGNTTPSSDSDNGSPVFVEPPAGLFGTIPGLDFIDINVYDSKNWDADLDDDGVELVIQFRSNDINPGYVLVWSGRQVAARIQMYIAAGYYEDEKKYDDPFLDQFFVLTSNTDTIQITFETYEPLIPDEDLNTRSDGDKNVYVVIEGTVVLADGSAFAARAGAILSLPNR